MSPVEKLEAAIDRLALLKKESTQDPWYVTWDAAWVALPPLSRSVTFDGYENADAELIVTLHRTIDAQISILKFAAGCDRPWKLSEPGYYDAELALADAILGDGS